MGAVLLRPRAEQGALRAAVRDALASGAPQYRRYHHLITGPQHHNQRHATHNKPLQNPPLASFTTELLHRNGQSRYENPKILYIFQHRPVPG
ncbi:hypothetical protein E2C01_015497 [Portunus trituberculatus]|uniref:Uncharacterized protein n=1 Tax=Portunus trituberculatus TaxID=210409 RepID=A0A5B7DLP3_PORTR|nr:hypothetical protein [Portunus trituberculatus]